MQILSPAQLSKTEDLNVYLWQFTNKWQRILQEYVRYFLDSSIDHSEVFKIEVSRQVDGFLRIVKKLASVAPTSDEWQIAAEAIGTFYDKRNETVCRAAYEYIYSNGFNKDTVTKLEKAWEAIADNLESLSLEVIHNFFKDDSNPLMLHALQFPRKMMA